MVKSLIFSKILIACDSHGHELAVCAGHIAKLVFAKLFYDSLYGDIGYQIAQKELLSKFLIAELVDLLTIGLSIQLGCNHIAFI